MLRWLLGNTMKKRLELLENKTESSFSSVKKDINGVGKWIKHLDDNDKHLFDLISTIKHDLSSIQEEIEGVREGLGLVVGGGKSKRLIKK